jgi:hypothetical protein
MWQCEQVKDWSDVKDSVAPAPVSNPQVENLNGGAKISYTLPGDADLLGVKAVFSLKNDGELKEAYASASKNFIVLEGYGDTKEYTVELYAIDKSENESTPVTVTIKPLTPHVELIRQSLDVQRGFAGIYLTWDNPAKKEIAIELHTADSTGYIQLYDIYYSNAEVGMTNFRGFNDGKEHDFKIEIRDRWLNYAAPLDTAITPLVEQNIWGRDERNQVIWTLYEEPSGLSKYRGDVQGSQSTAYAFLGAITDGALYSGYAQLVSWSRDFFPETTQLNFSPYYMTLDMGKSAAYNRFTIWLGNRNPIGSACIFGGFSVWGSNNPKPVDVGAGMIENLKYWTSWGNIQGVEVNGTGAWMNDWEKLGEYKIKLPSGLIHYAAGQLTAEDQQQILDGFEFEIDPTMVSKSFRYLRFYMTSDTWEGNGQIMMGELRFFGQFTE